MRRRTAFRSYFLARLILCVILLAQSSMASAVPPSWPNRARRATPASSVSASPGATDSHTSTPASANAPAAGCAPNACTIYLPWLVVGVSSTPTPTTPTPTPTSSTPTSPTPTTPTPTAPPTPTPTSPTPTSTPTTATTTPTPTVLPTTTTTPTPTSTPTTATTTPTPAIDIDPPSAPLNLRATGKTATTIGLAWDAAADNIAVTRYALYSSATLVLTTTSLFATVSALTAGTTYTFTVIARDAAGNLSPASAQLAVTTNAATQPEAPDTHAPTTPAHLRASGTTYSTIALAWDSSSDDVAVAEYDLYDNGEWIDWTTETSYTITNLPAASGHVFTIEAYDTSWNVSDTSDALHINTDVPPDPSTFAPAVDQTVASDIAGDTAFIYSGPDPIQSGVAPNTIQAQRVAILRGRVVDRNGEPLAGVHISVLDHPEYGGTASRADGAFDLAVNGGGPLTVDYDKEGYLPAQRQAVVPWRDYVALPDVALLALDQAVTTIGLTQLAAPAVS